MNTSAAIEQRGLTIDRIDDSMLYKIGGELMHMKYRGDAVVLFLPEAVYEEYVMDQMKGVNHKKHGGFQWFFERHPNPSISTGQIPLVNLQIKYRQQQ